MILSCFPTELLPWFFIKSIEDRGNGKYDVCTKDGYRMRAEVGTKTKLFGEERYFFKWID